MDGPRPQKEGTDAAACDYASSVSTVRSSVDLGLLLMDFPHILIPNASFPSPGNDAGCSVEGKHLEDANECGGRKEGVCDKISGR